MKNHYELVFCRLLLDLKKNGISRNRLNEYRKLTERFLKEYHQNLISSYDDFVLSVSKTIHYHILLWDKIAIIKSIRDYDLHGKMPRIIGEAKYTKLSSDYKLIVDDAVTYASMLEKSERTQQNLREDGAAFLYYLETIGIMKLEDVTLAEIESYFYCEGKIIRGFSARKRLNYFLKYCFESTGDCIFKAISAMLPKIVNVRKIYPSLSNAEAKKIEAAILDNTNTLTWRDRAIGALSYYTGMRSCDIAALKYDNIMWQERRICFLQSKTDRMVSLRLDPAIGNPIYEYIVNERPKAKSPFIFVRKKKHTPIDRHHVYSAIVSIFFEAGVRVIDGRRGAHLLRHNLATTMVMNNTDISIVSSALGHASSNSVNSYLEADTKHLKYCAIPIDGIIPESLPIVSSQCIIKKLLNFISINPHDVIIDMDRDELKRLGLAVPIAPLRFEDDNYYILLKSFSIDNSFINKI